MSTSSASSPGRVVVALDTPSLDDLAIEVAREIARSPMLELLGLFVEDARLLEHASAPLAREIAMSGRARPLEASRLERELRARATLARGTFEEAATRAGLRHAFQVARGTLADELLRASVDAEALIIALDRRDAMRSAAVAAVAALAALPRARLRALLFARENPQSGEGILAVVEAGAAASEPLRVAARLAERATSPVRILLTKESQNEELVRVQVADLRRRGIALELLPPAAELSPETIARHARDARLSIMTARGPPYDERVIERVLAKTRAALLLIRGD